jgi:hypothetical protein
MLICLIRFVAIFISIVIEELTITMLMFPKNPFLLSPYRGPSLRDYAVLLPFLYCTGLVTCLTP